MTIAADHVRTTIERYLARYPAERAAFIDIYQLMRTGTDLAVRSEMRGHATAGALLLDPAGQVLHIHHRFLDTWLLPGGHLEPEDATLLDAALREVAEETGIGGKDLIPVSREPIHVDIHPIPANPSKAEPAHRHIDFRFMFRTTSGPRRLQLEEVTASAWLPLDRVCDEVLRCRVAAWSGLDQRPSPQ